MNITSTSSKGKRKRTKTLNAPDSVHPHFAWKEWLAIKSRISECESYIVASHRCPAAHQLDMGVMGHSKGHGRLGMSDLQGQLLCHPFREFYAIHCFILCLLYVIFMCDVRNKVMRKSRNIRCCLRLQFILDHFPNLPGHATFWNQYDELAEHTCWRKKKKTLVFLNFLVNTTCSAKKNKCQQRKINKRS